MKKIISSVAVLTMALALTACGAKAQSTTYVMESDLNGVIMTDTMTLDAKGDAVQQMTEVVELDMTGVDETTQSLLAEQYDLVVDAYNAVEGVECTSETGEGTYSITIVIDATGGAIAELASQGLLQVEGSTDGISLEGTGEALTASGYTLQETAE